MSKMLWILLSLLLLGGAAAHAAAPAGYVEKEVLFTADLSAYAAGSFPGDVWGSLPAPNLPADFMYKVVADPFNPANRVLHAPFFPPGSAGNCYIATPQLKADTPYLLIEFDLYMAQNEQDVSYFSGIYLFGAVDWPPHTQVYIRPDQNTVELGRWLHYTWLVDASKNVTTLYIDGKLIKENVAFRTKNLDTAKFKAAFYTRDGYADTYFDNLRIVSLAAQ